MEKDFAHQALYLNQPTKIIFIAMSKHAFYLRRHAVKYVLEKGYTPISQYGIFDYFLTDTVDRDLIRRSNNHLLRISDEMWVIGPISDGVYAEIKLAKKMKKPIHYFQIMNATTIEPVSTDKVVFEGGLDLTLADIS